MKRLNKNLLTIIRIAIGVGLLGYILSAAGNWPAPKTLLSRNWIIPVLIIFPFIGTAVESMRLGLLFKSQHMYLSFGNGCRLVAIGSLFNFVVPGGTGGDVMKLYYLASGNRGRVVEVATILFVDRAVALFSLLCLLVGLALMNSQLIKGHETIQWLVMAVIVGIGSIFSLTVISFSERLRISRFYRYVMTKIPLHRYLERASNAIYAFRNHKGVLLRAVLWTLFGHLALAGMFLAVGKGFMPHAQALDICMLALLGMLANALPITPGGLGVGEAAFDHLFSLVGLVGGAFLILAYRLSLVPLCIVGCILYIRGARRQRHLTNLQEESRCPYPSR